MRHLLLILLLAIAAPTRAEAIPGTMDVRWNAGARDCTAQPQPPLQVHAYEPQTFILRQNPCADFEANFVYLLVGSERALLIDTGAIAEPERMPLAEHVDALLPRRNGEHLPLTIVHTHGHRDHRAGDTQFANWPDVRIAPLEPEPLREFLRLPDWPRGHSTLDLGDRTVTVLPAPGHHPTHLLFHDDRTALLFSGDFLLPGRLMVDDIAAYRESATRAAAFFRDRPIAHVLGAHLELDADGNLFPRHSQHRPNERPLQLDKATLLALPEALASFNGFYARHDDFVVVDPVRNLIALAVAVIVVLALAGWVLWRWLRRRKLRSSPR